MKDYKCDSCGKSFAHSWTLKKHVKIIHEGEKNHKCNICGKSFSYAGGLKKHINDGHDYKCETCGNKFSHAGDIIRHVKAVHEGVKYEKWFLWNHLNIKYFSKFLIKYLFLFLDL